MSDTTPNDLIELENKNPGAKSPPLNEGLYGPEVLKGIKSEIVAGSVLLPKDDADRAWNDANMRAARILSHYIEGKGMFQTRAT